MNIGGSSTLYDVATSSTARVGTSGALNIAEPVLVCGGVWDGAALDTIRWAATIVNSATSVVGAGINTLETNTSANASIKVRSTKVARFFAGSPNLLITDVKLGDTGTANNVRRWGAFDDDNGVFFQLSGTTFSVVTRKATSDTAVASGSFNGSSFTMDTNYHTYEIIYSENKVVFIIDKVVRHTATFATTLWTDTLNLKIGYDNTNSGGSTTDLSLTSRCAGLYRFGRELTRPHSVNVTTAGTNILKTGPGTLHRIIIGTKSTSTSTATIYDNSAGSGTVLAIVDLTNIVSNVVELNLDASIGICVVSSATVGNFTCVFD